MRHVVFRLGKEAFALPLGSVREVVVPPSPLSRVPRAPRPIRGVVNLRGRVVTVIDLARLLLPDVCLPDSGLMVLLDRGRRDLGLLVSEVEGIESLDRVGRSPGVSTPAVNGLARLKGLAVTVLDPDGLDGVVGGLFRPSGAVR